jgi:hypothetical protein
VAPHPESLTKDLPYPANDHHPGPPPPLSRRSPGASAVVGRHGESAFEGSVHVDIREQDVGIAPVKALISRTPLSRAWSRPRSPGPSTRHQVLKQALS